MCRPWSSMRRFPSSFFVFFSVISTIRFNNIVVYCSSNEQDGTLIVRKNPNAPGFQGPMDENDWRWFNSSVPKKLRELHDDGYALVIFTNQGFIQKAMLGANSTKIRGLVRNVLKDLDAQAGCHLPVQVVMATARDPCEYRKPRTGMWKFFVDNLNGSVAPDLEKSFYVGDAAGRPDDINSGADSDKAFAAAVGISFKLPEEFFGCDYSTFDGLNALSLQDDDGDVMDHRRLSVTGKATGSPRSPMRRFRGMEALPPAFAVSPRQFVMHVVFLIDPPFSSLLAFSCPYFERERVNTSWIVSPCGLGLGEGTNR